MLRKVLQSKERPFPFNWVRRKVRRKVKAGGDDRRLLQRSLSSASARESNARKLDADAEEDPKCTDGPWYRSRVSRGFLFGWREGLRNSELSVLRTPNVLTNSRSGRRRLFRSFKGPFEPRTSPVTSSAFRNLLPAVNRATIRQRHSKAPLFDSRQPLFEAFSEFRTHLAQSPKSRLCRRTT